MNNLIASLISAIIMGIGATLTFDLWSLFLKYVFKITPSDFCLVGRWVLYMPEGIFRHSNIRSVPHKKAECAVGWMTHYIIGIMFAATFLGLMGKDWLQNPTLISALIFGMVTVSAPFLIMQPSFGLGVAASKTSSPMQARLRSLMNHAVFGVGLYLFGLLTSWFKNFWF